MENLRTKNLRVTPRLMVWMAGFVLIALVGGSLTIDLSGVSPADRFVVAHWSLAGLRVYLWLEGAVLVGLVTALGAHIIFAGLAVARGDYSRLFGGAVPLHPRTPHQVGYVFVVLGAALVALSLTTLVLLNSCRYMRII